MYIAYLRFGENKAKAGEFMEAHNAWIAQGFCDGVFQCVGSLASGGGAIIAHGEDEEAFQARINRDPFVEQGVVNAEIEVIEPKKTIEALDFLKRE